MRWWAPALALGLGLGATAPAGAAWGYEVQIDRLRYGTYNLEESLLLKLVAGDAGAWAAFSEGLEVDLGQGRSLSTEPLQLQRDPETGRVSTVEPLVVSNLHLAEDLSLQGRFDFSFTPPDQIALREARVDLFGGTLIIEPTEGTLGTITLTARVRNLEVSKMLEGIPNFEHTVEAWLDGDLTLARRGSVFYIIEGRLALAEKIDAKLSIKGQKGWLVGEQPKTPWWQKMLVGEKLSPYRTEDALANLKVRTMTVKIDARGEQLVDISIDGVEAVPPKGAEPLEINYNPKVRGEGDVNAIIKMIFRNALDVRIGVPPDLEQGAESAQPPQ